jgi:hypothetical protein
MAQRFTLDEIRARTYKMLFELLLIYKLLSATRSYTRRLQAAAA